MQFPMSAISNESAMPPSDFIRDIEAGKTKAPVTRFPPETNGYLHIGHANPICLNIGIAREEFDGVPSE